MRRKQVYHQPCTRNRAFCDFRHQVRGAEQYMQGWGAVHNISDAVRGVCFVHHQMQGGRGAEPQHATAYTGLV